ncbi:DUF1772 domain-containing protein [Microbispora corallina]|uniref:Membrane protein n=1 Tax=Microbispora corallina TaxID=83302 RepID=A0ABQ4FYX8_9ACTN|nr:anthrone oxygenase family protein [Microbispora corallina]GIH40039.1 membrane protein [Microbispora corallina]
MPDTLRTVALLAAVFTSGLLAGLFYAFACAVMPGLRRAADRTLVDAMQRINVAILNGWFALTFAGAPILTAVTAALHLGGDARRVLPWAGAALLFHCAALAVTFAINIPLNNALDAAGEPDRLADPRLVRDRFEALWVRWNLVRAAASAAAFGCLAWALLV